jgi:hypothetical protein
VVEGEVEARRRVTRLGISAVRVDRTSRDGMTVDAEVSAATLSERSE